MSRPTRLLFAGAIYHVISRGNRLGSIFEDDADRRAWFAIFRDMCKRFDVVAFAYCQMTNHFHLLIETRKPNLPDAMRHLNGVYTQYFNRKHGLVGHLFQGRYKSILVQQNAYLLELARYIVLNPVRAGMVASPADWDWSSFRWMARSSAPPEWIDTRWLLKQFADEASEAVVRYRRFVQAGIGGKLPVGETLCEVVLGDARFAGQVRQKCQKIDGRDALKSQHRFAALTLEEYRIGYGRRDEAMARAYMSMAFSMNEIGRYFGVSAKTVSRAVRKFEG